MKEATPRDGESNTHSKPEFRTGIIFSTTVDESPVSRIARSPLWQEIAKKFRGPLNYYSETTLQTIQWLLSYFNVIHSYSCHLISRSQDYLSEQPVLRLMVGNNFHIHVYCVNFSSPFKTVCVLFLRMWGLWLSRLTTAVFSIGLRSNFLFGFLSSLNFKPPSGLKRWNKFKIFLFFC